MASDDPKLIGQLGPRGRMDAGTEQFAPRQVREKRQQLLVRGFLISDPEELFVDHFGAARALVRNLRTRKWETRKP